MRLKQIAAGLIFSGCLMAAGQALTIPKDATTNADGTYTWTDKQGKTWTYVETPFGVSRTLETDAHPKKALPKGVPAGAKANPDGTYRWTDKSGAAWNYLVTPFGVTRNPAAKSETAPAQQTAGVKVIDKGDTVRFERVMPFGTSVTEKKKSELTDDERRLLEQQSASSTATTTATTAKANQ
jgi:hypothetical protein